MTRTQRLQVRLLKKIGYVNADFYLRKYADVASAGLDPVEHYVLYGKNDGRSANEFWNRIQIRMLTLTGIVDEEFYLRNYPDVKASGLDATRHYVEHGRREGRSPNGFGRIFHHKIRARAHAKLVLSRARISTHLDEGNARACAPEGAMSIELDAIRDGIFSVARYGSLRALDSAIENVREALAERGLLALLTKADIIDVRSSRHVEVTMLEPAVNYEFREPLLIGEAEERPIRSVEVPSTWMANLDDVEVVGGFQVMSRDGYIWYEPAADQTNNFVAGTWPYVSSIKRASGKVVTWFTYANEESIPEGVLISGRCSPNYFHCMIEYITRVRVAAMALGDRRPPLIVDADMFPQEFEALSAVSDGWPVYKLRKSTRLRVGKIYIPSIPTYHPDSLEIPYWRGAGLNHRSVEFLRDCLLRRFAASERMPFLNRKIFLARRKGRNIENSVEVEKAFADAGFEIVDTSTMALDEQVALFRSASALAGPLGAAFTNLIFCDKRCRVLGLSSPYTKRFAMQGNLAAFAGCEYAILAGEHPQYRHGDELKNLDVNLAMASFTIPIDRLRPALSWLTQG